MQVQSFLNSHWRLVFSLTTASRLVRRFDQSKTNRLDLNSFLAYVTRTRTPTPTNQYTRLNKFLQEMQASLRYYDSNNDGLLTRQEVRQALQQSGFTFDDKVFAAVFQVGPARAFNGSGHTPPQTAQAFDPKLGGAMGLAEYIAMATALRNASTTFSAFDPQKQGRITLDYNQWVYACAQVL